MNPHGFGYCIVKPWDRLIIGKSMKAASLIEEFADLREQHPEGAALFHSRFATSGLKDESNCHPFAVGKDNLTVVAHNGILFGKQDGEKRSDTRIFAEEVMPVLFRRLNRPTVLSQMHGYVGRRNKLVILSANTRYASQAWIINEKEGTWTADGEWQSNWDYMTSLYARRSRRRLRSTGAALLDKADGEFEFGEWVGDGVPIPLEECLDCGGEVDKYGICTECGMCMECYQPDGTCLCYAPGKNHQ